MTESRLIQTTWRKVPTNMVYSNLQAVTSKNLMMGKKMKLFVLDLSYIGWYILSSLTFGILSLWVTPRHAIAQYAFFKDVDREHYGESTDDVVAEVKETVVDE